MSEPIAPEKNPFTGARLTKAEIKHDMGRQLVRYAPRPRPTQEYVECEYDDDDNVVDQRTVVLSDDEYASAVAAWEGMKANGWMGYSRGRETVRGEFEFDDSSRLEGTWVDGGWHWTRQEIQEREADRWREDRRRLAESLERFLDNNKGLLQRLADRDNEYADRLAEIVRQFVPMTEESVRLLRSGPEVSGGIDVDPDDE